MAAAAGVFGEGEEGFSLSEVSQRIVDFIDCDGATHEKLKGLYEKFRGRALALRRSLAKQLQGRIMSLFQDSLKLLKIERNLLSVDELSIASAYDTHSIPARLYRPRAAANRLIVYFHGGGWIQGSVQMDDELCRKFAVGVGASVLSVDYRLAPEYPFPFGLGDAVSAFLWAFKRREDGDFSGEIYLCGESAGGNLAAAASLKLWDEFGRRYRPDGQILFYPPLSPNLFSETFHRFESGYVLTGELLRNFYYNYLGQEFECVDKENSYIFPCAELDATKFPRTFFVAAGLDPLCSNGEEFASRLREARVPLEYLRFGGALHGFVAYHGAYREEFNATVGKLRAWIDAGGDFR
ncbi:MAG: alpha/beta hydrolase [Puniceicoccales bacterium]|jgi:acetyl esterase|nr:alpha/beta hydrolase [Puniceicoccales bacterium]